MLIVWIQERAYGLFVSSGCERGHDLDHWLLAERQEKESIKQFEHRTD